MPIEVRVLPLDEFLFYLRLKFREVEQDNEILKTIIASMHKFIYLAEHLLTKLQDKQNPSVSLSELKKLQITERCN